MKIWFFFSLYIYKETAMNAFRPTEQSAFNWKYYSPVQPLLCLIQKLNQSITILTILTIVTISKTVSKYNFSFILLAKNCKLWLSRWNSIRKIEWFWLMCLCVWYVCLWFLFGYCVWEGCCVVVVSCTPFLLGYSYLTRSQFHTWLGYHECI
jgi:hypothetical protein